MRAVVIVLVVVLGRSAAAETSINFGFDVGTVLGHGPLTARFDPSMSAGADATFTRGPWMLDGGFVFLGGRSEPATRAKSTTVPGVSAIGWTAMVRRHFAPSDVGATVIGIGYSALALQSDRMPYGHAGRAHGPKVTIGLDYTMNAKGRRVGVMLGATYQYLAATFDDGSRSRGGYAGLELSLLNGWSTCRDWTSTNCGSSY